MESVILILTLLVVVILGLGVYLGVKAVRAAKRGVDRTISHARRTVEDTALRAKSLGQPGPSGDLAQLRLSLRRSMAATEEALRAGAAEDASLGESLALFQRLRVHADELDAELRRAEREPDKSRVAARLPELRERTQHVTHSADSLRWAAQDRARRFAQDDLADLSRQIETEAGALRHWAPAPDAAHSSYRGGGLTGGDLAGGDLPATENPGVSEHSGTPERPAASGAARASEAAGATGAAAGVTGASGGGGTSGAHSAGGPDPAGSAQEPAGPAAGQAPPPALEAPPEHLWRPEHSWQRAPRPERG
ncbi:hypothetical protein IHE55_08345 [Streptomyces pactum]|uniref:Secreted protein n=1 Tax=Streptomyces pactum TaxID=68249 RepID=A0ABS0NI84_9ACTN|nr:hypothetical protein [Streptomyces pactum]MBH5334804.1 hypothetical protein [Streptomyces pactum]